MKICILNLLPEFRVVLNLFFSFGSKSYMTKYWINGKNICSLKEKTNSLHVRYCWLVFMASSWKQWPVDQLWPLISVMQFTGRLFSIILLPVNANISLNVLPCERCLRNLQKGIGFLSAQMVQPRAHCTTSARQWHQKCQLELNGYKYMEMCSMKSLVMFWRQSPKYIKHKGKKI